MKMSHVLIVGPEDEPSGKFQKWLTDLGYSITGLACDAKSALASIETNRPDLILMVLDSSRKSEGIFAAQEIRRAHDLPVVFLSRSGNESYMQAVTPLEWPDGLPHPGDGRDLCMAIESTRIRHQIERRVRESESRMGRSIKAGKVGLWEWDLKTNRMYFSAEWKRQIGYEKNQLRDTLEEWRDHVHPDESAHVFQMLEDFIRQPTRNFQISYRLRHKDGSYRWILAQASLEHDRTGRPSKLLGSHVDITDQKEHEDEIERLNRLYRALSLVNGLSLHVTSREELLSGVCQILVDCGQLRLAWIGWLDPVTQEVRPVAHFGVADEYLKQVKVYADNSPLGLGPTGTAIREGRPVICNDFLNSSNTLPWRDAATRLGLQSSGSFPIRHNNQVCGALMAYASERSFFRDKEIVLFEEAAADISFALDHLELERHRREAEDALREGEAELRAMFDVASIGIAQSDPQTGRLLKVNQKLCDICGYSSAELLEMKIPQLTHPDDRQQEWDLFQQLVRGEMPDYRLENRHIRKDGAVVWVSVNMTLIRDATARPHRTMATIEEITERKQAEEQIRKLMRAVEQSPAIIMITDLKGLIEYVNPKFTELTGYTLAEVLGKNPRILKGDKTSADEYRHLWEMITREGQWSGEFRNRKKNGELYWEFATISPIIGVNGRPTHFLAVKEDITQRKTLEAQLRQAQKLDSVGQLAGGVAHDFNNILALMMMHLGSLQEKATHDRETRQSLTELMDGAKRAASLTRQLLMFSRRSFMDVKPLDLNELTTNLLKMLGRLLGEHIKIQLELCRDLPAIEADSGMIEQVIMNLTVNARDALPKGGKMTIKTEVQHLDPARTRGGINLKEGLFVCLSVTDNGCGMDDATLKRIFEPFFTTKEPGKGTGLGLATVYGIVSQHKGWVDVESTPAFGTTFNVYLPAAPHTQALVPATDRSNTVRGHETILLVEDDPSLRRVTAQSLRQLGYRLLEAANGHHGLTLWQEHAGMIDLLFTDMVMPEGMTGADLAEKLRENRSTLKVIIASGYSTEIFSDNKARIQGVTYLQKPYQLQNLSKTIRDCLDGR